MSNAWPLSVTLLEQKRIDIKYRYTRIERQLAEFMPRTSKLSPSLFGALGSLTVWRITMTGPDDFHPPSRLPRTCWPSQ